MISKAFNGPPKPASASATIGENQVLRRAKAVSVSQGAVIPYVHNAAAPGLADFDSPFTYAGPFEYEARS